MNTREQNLAWWIAGVLLVLLIIVGYLWLSSRNLPTVLQNGHDAVAAEQAQIRIDCKNPKSQACQQDLSDLEDILNQFNADLKTATST